MIKSEGEVLKPAPSFKISLTVQPTFNYKGLEKQSVSPACPETLR